MADDKFTRMARTLPSMYHAEVNTMIKGLLKAWGVSDDEIVVQISEAKKSLFQATAQGRFLDLLANNVGVSRSPQLGIGDDDFRNLIPVLSFKPKQVRQTVIDLLDVFWGPLFTRANVNSGNTEPFNFGPSTLLSGTANFINGNTTVKGIGTNFLTSVAPGDYIKPNSVSGIQYSKVSQVLSDTVLKLSMPWNFPAGVNVTVEKGVTRVLNYTLDARLVKSIRFTPNAFNSLATVQASEIVDFINNHPEHSDFIRAQVFLDPILGNKLNIRTNTPGIQGSIQITGGDANDPIRLNFPLTLEKTIKAGVFEINPNEVVILIPSSVPVLRRTLRGSEHPKQDKTDLFSVDQLFDFNSLGPTSTLTLTVDSNPYMVTFTNSMDFADPSKATAAEVVSVINAQLTFLTAFAGNPNPRAVRLRTTNGAKQYQITGGTANTVLNFSTALQKDPDLIIPGYPSAYVFSPGGQLFTLTQVSSTLAASISAGTLSSTLNLTDASSFPNMPGKFILDFGRDTQEGPIAYNSRPNNSTLLIDASYIFQKDHATGRQITLISDQATIPRVTGDDFAVYLVDTQQARAAAQSLIQNLLAAGVVIRFVISFPEVLFECVCRTCGPSTDASLRGSRTLLGPLVF